jgi:polyisoprenyl-phosphate glycosyltransferase
VYFLFILVWLIAGESAPPGWASTVSVTLLLNSVTLAFVGIIGVYVARIYNEVRARPSYLVGQIEAPVLADDGSQSPIHTDKHGVDGGPPR